MIERYGLEEFFSKLSNSAENSVHRNDFREFHAFFPRFCSRLDLSLRDIDYCIRSMALVGKNIQEKLFMYPYLLGVLIVLRLKNQPLYWRFMTGEAHGAEVMDSINELGFRADVDDDLKQSLLWVEVDLYRTDDHTQVTDQLELLKEGKPLTHPEYLSEKTRDRKLWKGQDLEKILKSMPYHVPGPTKNTIRYLGGLIELFRQ